MKFRLCVPDAVPGTGAHGDHDDVEAVNLVNWTVFAVSPLITNSQTLVPSVAPNSPLATVDEGTFIDNWLLKLGGAGENVAHVSVPALYDAPANCVPPELLRRNA